MRCALTSRLRLQLTILFVTAAAAPVNAITHDVIVRNFEFAPSAITVAPGDTVRWTWESGTHTVTSGTPCTFDGLYFDSPMDSVSTSFEFVIPDGVSEIPYFCRPHCLINMTGMITVDPNAIDFVITLDGDQAVPSADTTGAGSGVATYFPSTSTLAWDFSFADLIGAETAAHIHGAAPQCEVAGIQITLPLGSPKAGSATLTAQQEADLLAGLWYVNIHSSAFPAGEIRGQIMPAPLINPIPDPIPSGGVHVELETIATGLAAPNWGTFAPGDTSRLFVSDQNGVLWSIDLATGAKSVFLDVTSRLVTLGVFGPDTYDERGLLGVAFHPDYATNGLLYTYTSEPESGVADFSTMPIGEAPNHQAVIIEWQTPNPADPNSIVDPNSARELLRIDEPQFNHNGGAINFGADNMLYISFGDGGGADDKDGQDFLGADIIGHACEGNGGDNTNVLGTILRIDPSGGNSANGQYGIPADNPFVGVAGVDEIFAYGFRNPFRFSFDSLNGDLHLGDVGQNHIEEVDLVTSGGNYGWNHKEGSFFFVANGNQAGYVTDMPLSGPGGLTDPIAQYDHDEGIAIIGGFVYRGDKIPALTGRYVFGDWSLDFLANNGRLFYLDGNDEIQEFQLVGQAGLGMSLLGFGQDARGELYVLANTNGIPFGTTGVVLRIKAITGDLDADGDVDLGDLGTLLASYGKCVGDPGYDPAADFDNSGCIGLSDLGALLANYTG